ncbi:MAG: anthranilate synthase component I [Ignavibacteria bacterium]|jgi:anthranilate synthase component 1|nr:anthranilate synthase component I [Ignavibacteria bacterium]
MKFNDFEKLALQYNLIPVYEVITADLLTPVLAYLKIRQKDRHCFLLESVEGKEALGRYSFIGKDPKKFFFNHGENLTVSEGSKETVIRENLFDYIRGEMNLRRCPVLEELPFFTGGLVGYIGYENIGLIENVIDFKGCESENPDSILGLYETLIAFDHYKHQIILITNVPVERSTNLVSAFHRAKEKLSELRKELLGAVDFKSDFHLTGEVETSIESSEFKALVHESKKRITEGDIFQIVLSKRFSSGYEGDLLNVYRALRILNPSPYMYFLEFGDRLTVIGTSPENLVKVKNRIVETMPIAGTRKRGITPEEDKKLEAELVGDPKEQAEHVMLLDLGRNDLGRVCEFNSIRVVQQMAVQKYSHVMHMVSRVEGKLDSEKDCVDALKACFPAGTVTGAPKIKAMQLIKGYERQSRNVYAGAIGHIDFSGNMDMCIAIRTLFAGGGKIHWQAGAGIVADSIPELEEKEIRNKSEVLRRALIYAGGIDEDTCN